MQITFFQYRRICRRTDVCSAERKITNIYRWSSALGIQVISCDMWWQSNVDTKLVTHYATSFRFLAPQRLFPNLGFPADIRGGSSFLPPRYFVGELVRAFPEVEVSVMPPWWPWLRTLLRETMALLESETSNKIMTSVDMLSVLTCENSGCRSYFLYIKPSPANNSN